MPGNVIYLGPKQNRWGDIGQGILSLAQQIGQARAQQMDKQKAAAIAQITDPSKQADAAMRAFGPDGGSKLIQQLTQAKLAPLALQKAQLDITLDKTQNLLDSEKLKEMPQQFQADLKYKAAQTLAEQSKATYEKAALAGIPLDNAAKLAQISETRARTASILSELDAKKSFAQSLDAMLKGAPPDATVAQPGAAPGTPPPPGAAQPKHVASVFDFVLGRNKDLSQVDLPPVQLSPGVGNKLHMTPEQAQTVQMLAASGDISGAMKEIGGAGKITSRYDKVIVPGFKMKIGVRDDGSEVPLSSPRYEPNRTNLTADTRAAQGIALWNATVDTIKKISEDPKMGNQGTRLLMGTVHSVAPFLDLESVFGKGAGKDYYDWQSQAGHALIAAAGLLSGARSNQMLMKSLEQTIPKPGQPMDQIISNLQSSRRVTDTMARDLMMALVANGSAVPEQLSEIINKGGLDKKSQDQISSEGIGSGSGDAAKTATAPGGDRGPAGEAGSGGADGAAADGGGSTGSGTDIKPQVIGGKLITPEYVEQIAKEHGLTPEQVLQGLKNAAGQ